MSIFGFSSIYVYPLPRRTTKFGVVTYGEVCACFDVSHGIAYCKLRRAVCQR